MIFEPFAHKISSMASQIWGTGLGMPIVKNLMELMGGRTDVKSKQSEGSIFTVELELRIQDQKVNEGFWEKHGTTRALVVDDDETICTNVIRAMGGTGVSVQYAPGGDRAIHQIRESHQEGIVLDPVFLGWKVPDTDGIQTARNIRAMLSEHIPTILSIVYEWGKVEEEVLAAGIDGFLVKPFFLTSFKQAIVTVQAKKQKMPGAKDSDCGLSGVKVLTAEGNELNAKILRELLHMSGMVHDIVSNSQELLDAFGKSDSGQYDLILTGIRMPAMNGYDAARVIQAGRHPHAKIIPIIAMTTNALTEDMKESADTGMDTHVPKSTDMKHLEVVIVELVKKKQG